MKGLYQKLTQGRISKVIKAGLVGLALAGCDYQGYSYSAQPNSETQKIVQEDSCKPPNSRSNYEGLPPPPIPPLIPIKNFGDSDNLETKVYQVKPSGNPEKPLRFYNGPAPVPASQKSNNIPFSPNLVQGDYTPEIALPPPKKYDGEYNEILEGIEKFKLRIDELDEIYNYLPGKTKDLDRVRIYTEKLKKMNEEDRKKLISETKGKGVTYYFDAGYYDLTPELGRHVTDSSNLFEISKFTIILNYINRDGIMSSEEKRFIKERCPKNYEEMKFFFSNIK